MNNLPLITIAICTFNRAGYLSDTLRDLSVQTADRNLFELIVIDNNSSDHTPAICDQFRKKNPELRFKSVREERQGLSHARNRAVEESVSGVLLFIDDDVRIEPGYTESALRYLEKYPDADCAGGRIFVSFDDNDPGWIPDELMPMFGLHDLGERVKKYPPNNFPRGGNMLIKREVFHECGLFDTELGRKGSVLMGSEEKAFFERARKNGFVLLYWPGMKLWHRIGSSRLEETYLKRQSEGIGRSERLRVQQSVIRTIVKLMGETVKFAGSLVLAFGYLLRGNRDAAELLLKFRIWVLSGFLKPG